MSKPHVLVVGAGLGGLTLAQCLRKHGVPFEIFERDAGKDQRDQGYAIGLHTVLDELVSSVPEDLPDLKTSVDHLSPLNLDAQCAVYVDGQRLGVQNTRESPVIRANRTRLRTWLGTNIDVQWGKHLKSINQNNGKHTLTFDDGTQATGDVVIGADGINSVVREHVLGRPNSEVLREIKASAVFALAQLKGQDFEQQLSLGHSMYMLQSTTLRFMAGLSQVSPDGETGTYYWGAFDANDDSERFQKWMLEAKGEDKRQYALDKVAEFDPRFSDLIRKTPAHFFSPEARVIREGEIPELPVSTITLLGDAAHPMAPFRGEGGMHAFRDALNLAKIITELRSVDDIKPAFEEYQKEMVPRGLEATRGSRAQFTYEEGKSVIWGQTLRRLAEETVTLESCKPKE